MARDFKTALALLLAIGLAGCGFKHDKGSSNDFELDSIFLDKSGKLVAPPGIIPGYRALNRYVFEPRCNSCHDSRASVLSNYDTAKSYLLSILAKTQNNEMPKDQSPLSNLQKLMVQKWVNAGGPLDNQNETEAKTCAIASTGIAADFIDADCKLTLPAGKAPGYKTVRAAIFKQSCFGCHNDHPPQGQEDASENMFDTYDGAMSMIEYIGRDVYRKKSMPKSGPLAKNEQAFVKAWIDAGSPKDDVLVSTQPNVAPSVTPSVVPSVEPSAEPSAVPSAEPSAVPSVEPSSVPSVEPSALPSVEPSVTPGSGDIDPIFKNAEVKIVLPPGKVPGYNTLRTLILEPRCLNCHTGPDAKKNVDLSSYSTAKAFLDKIANEVYIEQSMPPEKKGGALPANEQAMVKAWVDAGAPEADSI